MTTTNKSRADALTDRIKAMFARNPAGELGPSDEPESQYRLGYNTALEDVLGALENIVQQPAATQADERATFEASADGADAAREYLVRYLRAAVGNDTFTQYIRAELAGDFALAIANAHADHSGGRND
ncbi:hypothetical protein WL05_21150 [Burkholderia ubonensis]|uniref:hypothetical protein n=1 Tax=Burkholderia ubonensis TaxID=101571 RepID=UPI000758367A|nr:hypothetical protein [Burkholderia ubonensis]KVO76960.1 hypothetical protein WJ79_11530 [Burkholderia ubonensis]KVX45322.1 hypothetical protein WL05_21150 [Burkholderia ubonensis]